MIPSRPLLRYFGGKFAVASRIVPYLPPHSRYTEAFCGAASILLHKPKSAVEILSDLDDDVVTTLQVIRDRPQELRRALHYTPFAETEYRRAFEPTDDPLEKVRRTLVRSHQGIAAMDRRRCSGFRKYAHNRTRGNSDTMCSSEWSRLPDAIDAWWERLREVTILNSDAVETLQSHDGAGTLHVVDPPYVIASRKMRCNRYRFEMTDEDHRELAEVLRSLEGMVMLCGYPSALYDELYGDWERIDIPFRDSTECLWRNPAAVKACASQPTIPGFDDLMRDGDAA